MSRRNISGTDKKRTAIVGLLLIFLIIIGDIVSGAIGLAGPAIPSDTCTISNNFCPHAEIAFRSASFGNSTSGATTIAGSFFTAVTNDTVVLSSTSPGTGAAIVSITDTFGDVYSRKLLVTNICPPCQILEIWTAKLKSSGQDQVDVAWNDTQGQFLTADYSGVAGVGNATGTGIGSASSGSFQIETEKAGSWIVGSVGGPGVAGQADCFVPVVLVPGTGLIQRIYDCSTLEHPGFASDLDISDNATALPAHERFTYSETMTTTAAYVMGAIELISMDQEPQNPDFTTFCTQTNGKCVVTQYSLNMVNLATAPSAVNKGLAVNTAYCTGVTTSALTTVAANRVIGWGEYGGVALNQTNPTLLVQFYISTNAPSTTFGVGLCATGGTIIGTVTLFFPYTGALNANRTVTSPINSFCVNTGGTCASSGTFYGWYEITARDFSSGSLGWDQTSGGGCANICFYSINMEEVK